MSTAVEERDQAAERDRAAAAGGGGDNAGGSPPPAADPTPEPEKKGESRPTRYRVLWGKVPDEDAELQRPAYREILNPDEPDGAYVATSAETARRRAFNDERTDQHPHIQAALRGRGVVIKHVAIGSWGDDEEDLAKPLKIETTESLTGSL